MNTTQLITAQVPETHKYKVVFKPQGIFAYVHCILPKGGILRFEKKGNHACACFDNVIDYNAFRTKLSYVTTV